MGGDGQLHRPGDRHAPAVLRQLYGLQRQDPQGPGQRDRPEWQRGYQRSGADHPAPGGTRDLFYIFTNNNGNIYYSIADLAAQPNKPNGRVTVKNQGPLATNTGETQGMVPHADGRAIWLLVYNTGATVDAYLVDGPSGVNAKPVSSPTGLGGLGWASIVHSPDYNTLALGNSAYGIAIGRIDRATGNISNVQLRVKGSDVGYSSAFSPDGTKLYYARGRPQAGAEPPTSST